MDPDSPRGELEAELEAELDQLAQLIGQLDAVADGTVREAVIELLRSVDRVHRPGLRALRELVRVAGLERRALDDPEIRLLWDMYDLGEDGDAERAKAVLATVSPYIESHGGVLEVVGAERGVVSVALDGACSGCQGSTATLRHVIEGALRDGLPDFVRLEVVERAGRNGHDHAHMLRAGPAAPAGFVPLESLRPASPGRLTWQAVLDLGDLPPGSCRSVSRDGDPVLVVNLDGDVYAYRDECPGTPLGLGGARLEDGSALVCPWHGCRFDARGGRRIDTTGPGLGVVPIAVVDGEIRIGRLAPGPA